MNEREHITKALEHVRQAQALTPPGTFKIDYLKRCLNMLNRATKALEGIK